MKRKIIFLFSLLIIMSIVFSQSLEISDFYIIDKNYKISLGHSLLDYDNSCINKQFKEKETGNMKYKIFDYPWGKIYTSAYSTDYMIFGIEINSSEISIIQNIKLGTDKNSVQKKLGLPDYSINNIMYYHNDDFDVLELKLFFDKEDKISKITLFMGT